MKPSKLVSENSIEQIARRAAELAVYKMEDSTQSILSDDNDDDDASESEYGSSSEYDSSSSCLSSGEEEKFLSMIPASQMKRSTSLPTLNDKEEMSPMQVAILLSQARIEDQKNQVSRRNSLNAQLPSNRSISSAPGLLVNRNVSEIRGEGMKSDDATDGVKDPKDVFHDILVAAGFTPRVFSFEETDDFFFGVTSDRMNSYSKDIITAVKGGDLNLLRMAHFDLNRNLNCCNRFGESVLHAACRHSNLDVVKFLVREAKVQIRVRDDYGRTPCHDAAWQAEPNMELIKVIITHCPDLLLVQDKRGFSPLQYIRKAQWSAWNKVFEKNKEKILPRRLLKPIHESTL